MLLGIPGVGVTRVAYVADGGEIRGGELVRRTVCGRRIEKRRRSGGDSAAIDRRLSGEDISHRAKVVERFGFDDIHPQILREGIGNGVEEFGGV